MLARPVIERFNSQGCVSPCQRRRGPANCVRPSFQAAFKKLVSLGFDIMVETGVGVASGSPDADYEAAGADVVSDIASAIVASDVVVRVRKPSVADVDLLAENALHISFLDPFNDKPLVEKLAARGVMAVSMEMVPRTTRAQKMDALSSQANLAGYFAVVLAGRHCPRIFPMMMTPAGTISPARVFVYRRRRCRFAGDRDGEALGRARGGIRHSTGCRRAGAVAGREVREHRHRRER